MKAKRPFGLAPFQTPEGWGKPAKVTHLVKGEGEEKRLVGIKVETHDDKFVIPVVDVRTSEEDRKRAARIEKASKSQTGSKFMKPSHSGMGYSYNVSRKP